MDALILLLLYLAPYIACAASAAFTVLHTGQELTDDGAPVWRYLRLPVSDAVGFVGLVGFAAAQIGLAVHGYWLGDRWALWAILAARLGDCALSHWLPWLAGRRPNPGLATTPLYAIEAATAAAILFG